MGCAEPPWTDRSWSRQQMCVRVSPALPKGLGLSSGLGIGPTRLYFPVGITSRSLLFSHSAFGTHTERHGRASTEAS